MMSGMNLQLPAGSRTLLLGANGEHRSLLLPMRVALCKAAPHLQLSSCLSIHGGLWVLCRRWQDDVAKDFRRQAHGSRGRRVNPWSPSLPRYSAHKQRRPVVRGGHLGQGRGLCRVQHPSGGERRAAGLRAATCLAYFTDSATHTRSSTQAAAHQCYALCIAVDSCHTQDNQCKRQCILASSVSCLVMCVVLTRVFAG